jgi:hypothetical protein
VSDDIISGLQAEQKEVAGDEFEEEPRVQITSFQLDCRTPASWVGWVPLSAISSITESVSLHTTFHNPLASYERLSDCLLTLKIEATRTLWGAEDSFLRRLTMQVLLGKYGRVYPPVDLLARVQRA